MEKSPYDKKNLPTMSFIWKWTTWQPLPYDILFRMNDADHKRYCELYMKAHPGLANGLTWDEFKVKHKEYLRNADKKEKK